MGWHDWKEKSDATSLLDTVTALTFALDAKDHYTQSHSLNVSRFAAQIARQLGLSGAEIEEVRLGGILHDIGKIGLPDNILNKPSPLTPEEFEVVKSHAPLGARILKPLRAKAIEPIRGMVRHHHERVDGTGYPDGLKGEKIPLGARIIAVAEAFDVITSISYRVYQQGRSVEEAVAELRRCSGMQFDPDIVDTFIRLLEGPGSPLPPREPG
jgi:putative nucleotidyltransferase with HDIG domain